MDKQLLVLDRFHLLIVETGEIIPAFAGGTGGGSDGPPPMSNEEKTAYAKQAEASDLYIQTAKKQAATAEALEPYFYKQLGLAKNQVQGERETTITSLKAQLAKTPPTIQQTVPGQMMGRGTVSSATMQTVVNPAYTQLQAQLKEWEGKPPTYKIEELPKEASELQRAEIQDLANKRTLASLKGELPVDPSVEKEIARGKSQLLEELGRRGIKPGSGDIYNRAISEFERGAGALRYDVQRGERTSSEAIAGNRQLELQRKQGQYIDQATGQQTGAAALFNTGAGQQGGIAQNLTANRFQNYQFGVQQDQARSAGQGQLIGAGIGTVGIGAAAFFI